MNNDNEPVDQTIIHNAEESPPTAHPLVDGQLQATPATPVLVLGVVQDDPIDEGINNGNHVDDQDIDVIDDIMKNDEKEKARAMNVGTMNTSKTQHLPNNDDDVNSDGEQHDEEEDQEETGDETINDNDTNAVSGPTSNGGFLLEATLIQEIIATEVVSGSVDIERVDIDQFDEEQQGESHRGSTSSDTTATRLSASNRQQTDTHQLQQEAKRKRRKKKKSGQKSSEVPERVFAHDKNYTKLVVTQPTKREVVLTILAIFIFFAALTFLVRSVVMPQRGHDEEENECLDELLEIKYLYDTLQVRALMEFSLGLAVMLVHVYYICQYMAWRHEQRKLKLQKDIERIQQQQQQQTGNENDDDEEPAYSMSLVKFIMLFLLDLLWFFMALILILCLYVEQLNDPKDLINEACDRVTIIDEPTEGQEKYYEGDMLNQNMTSLSNFSVRSIRQPSYIPTLSKYTAIVIIRIGICIFMTITRGKMLFSKHKPPCPYISRRWQHFWLFFQSSVEVSTFILSAVSLWTLLTPVVHDWRDYEPI